MLPTTDSRISSEFRNCLCEIDEALFEMENESSSQADYAKNISTLRERIQLAWDVERVIIARYDTTDKTTKELQKKGK